MLCRRQPEVEILRGAWILDDISSLLSILDTVKYKIDLAWGFKDELTRLRDSLTTIQAVLVDAERRQEGEEFMRLWLQRLKDAAFDADGVLDDPTYEILHRKVEIRNHVKRKLCFFFTLSNPIVLFQDGQQS
nr:disease resistance protein rga2 [Quercus suber]